LPAEIITPSQQQDAFEQLKRDPPLLVIGRASSYIGDEASRFLDEGWEPVAEFGGLVVSRRKDREQVRPAR
jgi:hypothetical protein